MGLGVENALAQLVGAGYPPFVVVSVDGGNSYWYRPTSGADAGSMVLNARLAMWSEGSYLLARLGPATPPDLADAVRAFGNGPQDIAINTPTGVNNQDPAQAARLKDTEAASNRVADLCK